MKSSKNQYVAIGLMILMLIKAWVIPMVYLDFELRRDYIVANLCVNRNRPQLKCDGKCYLAKRIAEAKKQEESRAAQDYLASLIYQVMQTPAAFTFTSPIVFHAFPEKVSFRYAPDLKAKLLPEDIFHPPVV